MELVLNFRPLYWICTLLIGVLGAPINGYLLLKEIRKRRDGFANFASKYMRIFSVSTLRSGFIAALFVALPVFPRFCYLDLSGKAIVFGFPIQCMARYQLSRLHYCFSNEQIHNRNGYPLSLFIVLIAFGPILLIDWAIVYLVAYPMPNRCGLKGDFIAFREYADYSASESGRVSIWFFCQMIGSWSWDIITLLLYCFKIWKIGKMYKLKHEEIWKNVLFILNRIAILTIFYLFCYLISMLILVTHGFTDGDDELYLVLSSLVNVLSSTSLSLSMHLMMEHNTAEYTIFLQFLKRFYLQYLCFCCCFHKMVDRQMGALLTGKEEMVITGKQRQTVTNTHRVASADINYGVKDNRMSVPTVTRVLSFNQM